MEVNCPGQRATVLVAFAWIGRTPTPSNAGNDKKEPPPAMALRAPARKQAMTSQTCCQCAILLRFRKYCVVGKSGYVQAFFGETPV
jgi:hypothetical protein